MIKLNHTIRWIIYYALDLIISHIILRFVVNPFACLFPVRQPVFTKVKRLGKMYATLQRDRLPPAFAWCDTPDNATDEWWYGMYSDYDWLAKRWTQSDYDNSRLIRYYCRVRWLNRNCGYGFAERVLGSPVEAETIKEQGVEDSGEWSKFTKREHSFQYEAQFDAGWIALVYGLIVLIIVIANIFSPIVGIFLSTTGILLGIASIGRYNSVNIGWKPHKQSNRLAFAGRLLGLRKY